jgi:hypothetical protein
MRPLRFIIIFALVVAAAMALVGRAARRARLASPVNTATLALFEFQALWTTDGNDVVFSRSRWPARVKAFGMNGVEVGHFSARASKREDGPLGIWWSSGCQIHREATNDNHWTLYRTYAFGLPNTKGLAWRNMLTVVTTNP